MLSFELPQPEEIWGNKTVTYRFSCNPDELDRLKMATINAESLLDSGIQVMGNLLAHVGMYQPEEFDATDLVDAGYLVAELARCRGQISTMRFILDHAEMAQ